MSNESGGILTAATSIDYQSRTFVLTVRWSPPRVGNAQTNLAIQIVQGKVGVATEINDVWSGGKSQSYSVSADPGTNFVRVIANTNFHTDSLLVSLLPPAPPPQRPVVIKPDAGSVLQSGSINLPSTALCDPGEADTLYCLLGVATIQPKSSNSIISLQASVETEITVGCGGADPWRRGEITLECGADPVRTNTNWANQTRNESRRSQSYRLQTQCVGNGQPVRVVVKMNPRGCSRIAGTSPSFVNWTEIQR